MQRLIANFWRQQGIPDSDETVSPDFLKTLAGRSSSEQRGPPTVPAPRDGQRELIYEDTEGFDCRIGHRARKQGRQAKSTTEASLEAKPKAKEARSAGDAVPVPVSAPRKADTVVQKRAASPTLAGEAHPHPPTCPVIEKKRRLMTTPDQSQASEGLLAGLSSTSSHDAKPAAGAPWGPIERKFSQVGFPPGWEVEIRPRQKAPAVDKNYFSPGGQKFGSMKRVQEHCAFWGIPVLTAEDMPKKGKDGNKRVDLKSLHRFILETARTGGLPKGRSKEHHLYFLAREKLRVEGSEKFVYGA